MMPQLYTVEEVAALLRRSPSSVRRWCFQGRIRYRLHRWFAGRRLRRQILIAESDLIAFIDQWLPQVPLRKEEWAKQWADQAEMLRCQLECRSHGRSSEDGSSQRTTRRAR
jgi:Helix-turn-helix domain